MRFLIVVSESPWGGSLATAALRCARALLAGGDRLDAVFFNGDGVYNALPGHRSDGGLPGPQAAWIELATRHEVDLLACSAAAERRLDASLTAAFPAPFRLAGLAALLERMGAVDRVVSF